MGFGANLVAIRKSKGMTRKELAEALEIPYTTLRNYETDQREPGHKFLIQLSKLFGVSIDELVGNVSPETKKAPGTPESAPREQTFISLDKSNSLLIALGLIREGQQLSDEDLAFLTHIIGLLEAWFGKAQ